MSHLEKRLHGGGLAGCAICQVDDCFASEGRSWDGGEGREDGVIVEEANDDKRAGGEGFGEVAFESRAGGYGRLNFGTGNGAVPNGYREFSFQEGQDSGKAHITYANEVMSWSEMEFQMSVNR